MSLSGIILLTVKAKKREGGNKIKSQPSPKPKKERSNQKESSSKNSENQNKPSLEDDFWDKIS